MPGFFITDCAKNSWCNAAEKCSNMPVEPPKSLPASVFLFNKSATISFLTKGYRKMQKFWNIDWIQAWLSLVPTSDITIIIIIISSNITLLCRLCLSGNVQKHNHKRPYDQHNHNHKKMIDHFLMIMIMSVTMTMLLFFIVGTRKS